MVKRPLAIIGAVFFFSVLAFAELGYEKAMYVLLLSLFAVFFLCLKKKTMRMYPIIVISVFCAVVCFDAHEKIFSLNSQYFTGSSVNIIGKICDIPYTKNGKEYFVIKTEKLNDENVKTKIRISVSDIEDYQLFDTVKTNATLFGSESFEDSTVDSLKSKNISLVGFSNDDIVKVVHTEKKPLMFYFLSIRNRITDIINKTLPNDYGSLISGFVLGDDSNMSSELSENLRICGISHLLTVSGAHTYIWSYFAYMIFSLFMNIRRSSLLSIVFILFFMAITGFSPSVIRAGVMMIIVYIGIIFKQIPDSINSLGIAAIILTAVNPFSVYSVGTLLSFASVFGIIIMNEYVFSNISKKVGKKSIIRKLILNLFSIVFMTISANIFTFPLSVFYGLKFSLLALPSNICLSALSSFIMVAGGVGSILIASGIFAKVGFPIFLLSGLASKLSVKIINAMSKYENMYINVSGRAMIIFVVLCAVVTLIFSFVVNKLESRKRVYALSLMTAFFLAVLLNNIYIKNCIEVAVINVGNGLCVVASYDGHTAMIGCGGDYYAENNIRSYLERLSAEKIDFMYLPSAKKSLSNVASKISEDYSINYIASDDDSLSVYSKHSIVSDEIHTELFRGSTKIDIYTQNNKSYALLTVGKKRFLIQINGKITDEHLKRNCINPDYYITTDTKAYNSDFSTVSDYIVSSENCKSLPKSVKKSHLTESSKNYIRSIIIWE